MDKTLYDYDGETSIGIVFNNYCSNGDCCDSEKIIQRVNDHTDKVSENLHAALRDTDIKKAVDDVISRITAAQNDINDKVTVNKNLIIEDIDDSRYVVMTDAEDKFQKLTEHLNKTNTHIDTNTEDIKLNDNTNTSNLIKLIETVYNGITSNDNNNRDTIVNNDNTNRDEIKESIKMSMNTIIKDAETNKNSVITNSDTNRNMLHNDIIEARNNINTNTNAARDNINANIESAKNNINSNTGSLFESLKSWLRSNMTWHS